MKAIYKITLILLSLALCNTVLAQEVVELKQPNSNKIVIKLMFRNGSISDPEGKEGLTALTASLVSNGGTTTMTKSEIDNKIYPMAAQYFASVDKEVSVFTFEFHKDWTDDFYPILKGLMLTPAFDEADFNRLKSNQQNFVDQIIRASSDEEYSKKALEDLLFRGTNYQHMVEGTSTGVSNITLEDVRSHYKQFFTRNNVIIGIAGNYENALLNKLKSDINILPDTKPALPTPGKPNQPNGIEVEIISKDNALGSAIFTGFPLAITRADDDFAALMIANSWLGEHRKSYSRLYQKIRETRSMNYGDYTYIEWYEQGGRNQLPLPGVPRSSNYFSIWIRPVQIGEQLKQQYEELQDINIGHAHFALRLAIREIDLLIKKGMAPDEFEKTREFLRSYIKLYIQTPEKALGFLMDSRFYGRTDYIKELDELLEKATLADVNAAIRKYFQTENMFVTIVTDDSEATLLAESLRSNTPSPMSYSNLVKEGLPQEVLDEDEEVAHYPLNVTSVKIVPDEATFSK